MTPSEESSGDEADLQRSSGGGLSRKGAPWSTDEHCSFLKGLEKLGKGNWRNISRFFVPSRTPTQVASHAQKHFLRIGSGSSRRRSRFTAIEEEVLANNPHHPHIPGPQRAALPSLPLQASSSAVAPRPALQLFAAVPPPYPQPSMLPAPMELGTAQQQPCTSGSSASESGMVATGTPCPQAQGLAVPGMPFFMSHMMGFGFPGGPMVPSPFPPPGAAAFPGGAPFSNAASSFQPGSFPSGPFQMAYGLPPGMPPFMFAQPPAAGTPVVVGAAPVVELPHGSYAVQQPAQSHGSPQASPQASSAPTSPCQSEVRAHTGCGMQAEEASQPAGHLQQQAHAELVAQAHCMLEEELSHPPQQCSGASRALHPQLLVLAIAAGLCEPDAAHAMDMAAMSCMEFTPVKAQEAPAVPSPPSTVAAEPGPVQSPQSMQAGQPQQHANAGPGQGCMAMGQPAAGAAPLGLTGPPPLTGCQPFMMHHPALMAGLLQPAHFHALVQAMQQQYTGSGMPAIQV